MSFIVTKAQVSSHFVSSHFVSNRVRVTGLRLFIACISHGGESVRVAGSTVARRGYEEAVVPENIQREGSQRRDRCRPSGDADPFRAQPHLHHARFVLAAT